MALLETQLEILRSMSVSLAAFRRKVVGDVATPDSEMERETSLLQHTTKSLTSVTRFDF